MSATQQQQQQQQLQLQQQQQQQRLLEIQRQKQLVPQQLQQMQQMQQSQPPYTQRMQAAPMQAPMQSVPMQSVPMQSVPMQSVPMQRVPTPQPQIVKADTPVPPGHIKLLMPNGLYQMESVETGSINFPYAEPHLAPTLILRNHDLDIIKLQGYHNDVSNQLAHLTTLVSRVNTQTPNLPPNNVTEAENDDDGGIEEQEIVFDEAVIHKITENPAFIANTVSHIMQNTNLSELVTEVNVVKSENRELRSILNSQHEMMNAMNLLLFKLLNKMHSSCSSSSSDDTITTETVVDQKEPYVEQNEPHVDQNEAAVTEPQIQESNESEHHKEKEQLSPIEEEEVASQENVPRDWLP